MCALEKRGDIFFLTITGDDEHRLNPNLLESLRNAREQSARGSALITTARGKFFSNGFDLAWAESAGSSFSSTAHDRGVLYMSQLDIGMAFPDNTLVLVRSKDRSAAAGRELMLKVSKVRVEEAVAMGIVEKAHCSAEATVEAVERLGEKLGRRKWNGEVYAEIRKGLYPELCGVLGLASKAAIVHGFEI
ncbi:hypothetical protein ACSBR1_013352 [Camellia fascicularis]